MPKYVPRLEGIMHSPSYLGTYSTALTENADYFGIYI
jgi:hypothetical protein